MVKRDTRHPVVEVGDQLGELDRLADRLVPRRNRAEVLERFEEMFRSGAPPDPPPSGPLDGRLLATSTWGPWDSVVQQLAPGWMPWLGKSFDPEAQTGVNHFLPTAGTRLLMKVMFPRYVPERERLDRIEAFPFRTRIAPGELDPSVDVLKIDYDFEPNPVLVRRILDELVQVAPGRYLGKVLMRVRDAHHRVGFFSLSL